MSSVMNKMGFSILEISIVLGVLGLLSITLINFYSDSGKEVKKLITETETNNAKYALRKFSMMNYRLPCPDTNSDGFEDCNGLDQQGWLPYKTLSMTTDIMDGDIKNRIQYGVYRTKNEKDGIDITKIENKEITISNKKEFTEKLRKLSALKVNSKQHPYVAGKNLNDISDCEINGTPNPAYIIAKYITRDKLLVNCFAINKKNSGVIIQTSFDEILGHIR